MPRPKMGMGALPPKGLEWTMGKTKGAVDTVNGIIDDLKDRCGGDGWWDSIDRETQDGIKGEWAEIVMKAHNMGPKTDQQGEHG